MIRRAPLALSLLLGLASAAQAGPARQCVDQSEALVGQRARLVDKDFAAPRRLTSNPFDYPTRAGATKAAGVWVGEALVDTAGKVRQVWTIRGFHFEPAWPEFDEAIAAGDPRLDLRAGDGRRRHRAGVRHGVGEYHLEMKRGVSPPAGWPRPAPRATACR